MWLISSIYSGHVKLQHISVLCMSFISGPKKILARGQNQLAHICKEDKNWKGPNILIVSL
jgi:hypothetical protein